MLLVLLDDVVSVYVSLICHDAEVVCVLLIDRMACPIRNLSIVMNHLCAVVHCLSHARSRSVDVFTPAESTLDRESLHRKRYLETELDAHMTLVDAAHREVGERVLRVVIEAHHVGLIHDLGVETGHADIVAVVAVLVVEVGRNGLHGLEIRNERVPCTRRDERLSECWSVIEVTSVSIDSVSACKMILKTELC